MKLSEEEKAEQDLAVALWQESGLIQRVFCEQEGISYNTFRGWVKRYRKTKGLNRKVSFETPDCFLDVEVKPTSTTMGIEHQTETITIRYPNGVELNCSFQLALSENLFTLLD